MLVDVYLHGELGKKFGKKWSVAARGPSHALRLINANTSGSLVNWLREKAAKFAHYRVLCEFQDGTKRQLSDEDFGLVHGELKTIRFVPVVVGAGGNGVLQTVVGVVLLVASIWYPALLPTAFGMLAGGISQLLAPKPKKNGESQRRTSHYFNGTEQTEVQGGPIKLIYGRCLVQGTPISVAMSIDQLLFEGE
ncbi:tail assembly protein [Acinetobacter baumannii]|nr:tail assembly protein [Acinetobacter baumannii]EKW7573665.1 tail assembly protein [Acinetobacter baumannii]